MIQGLGFRRLGFRRLERRLGVLERGVGLNEW